MAVEQNSIRWCERYYAARPASAVRVSPALADAVSEIDSPVVKLRFLRDVIDHHRSIPQPLRYRVIRPLRRAFTRLATFTSHPHLGGPCAASGCLRLCHRHSHNASDRHGARARQARGQHQQGIGGIQFSIGGATSGARRRNLDRRYSRGCAYHHLACGSRLQLGTVQ